MNLFKITFGTLNERFVFIDTTTGTMPEFLGFFENREELIEDNFFQAFANIIKSEENILEEHRDFIISSVTESGDVRDIDLMELSVIPEKELQDIQVDVRFACGEELLYNQDEELETEKTIEESYSEEDLVPKFD